MTDTRWQLVQFQSSDDAIGTLGPGDATRFTLELMADRLARDSGRVRSYTFKGGALHLASEADGGIYSWQRLEQ